MTAGWFSFKLDEPWEHGQPTAGCRDYHLSGQDPQVLDPKRQWYETERTATSVS